MHVQPSLDDGCVPALVRGVRGRRLPSLHPADHTRRVLYVSGSMLPPRYQLIARFDANNHLINLLACRVTTTLLGASELTMRLPSLAGGALYLAVVFLLCRHVFGLGPFFLIATVAVGPESLDPRLFVGRPRVRPGTRVPACRHVSTRAVYRRLRLQSWPCRRPQAFGDLRRMSCALAIHSNLTFLIGSLSLIVVFLAAVVQNGRVALDPEAFAELCRGLRRDFVRPGLWVFGVLAVTLFKMRPSAFYVGEGLLAASLQGMVDASLAHHHTTWPWDTASSAFQQFTTIVAIWGTGLVLAATASAWIATAVQWVRDRSEIGTLRKEERFLLLSGGTLLLSYHAGVPRPIGNEVSFRADRALSRPALFLAGLTVLHETLHRKKARLLLGVPSLAFVLLLVVQFSVQLPATYYRPWRYDCTSRQVFQTIADRTDRSSGAAVGVVCQWWYLPSLDFYRTTRQATWLEFVDARSDTTGRTISVSIRCRTPPMDQDRWMPVFESDESEVVVAVASIGRPAEAATSLPSMKR